MQGKHASSGIFRSLSNKHRYFYFANGKLHTFLTTEQSFSTCIASLFGSLNQTIAAVSLSVALLAGLQATAHADNFNGNVPNGQFNQIIIKQGDPNKIAPQNNTNNVVIPNNPATGSLPANLPTDLGRNALGQTSVGGMLTNIPQGQANSFAPLTENGNNLVMFETTGQGNSEPIVNNDGVKEATGFDITPGEGIVLPDESILAGQVKGTQDPGIPGTGPDATSIDGGTPTNVNDAENALGNQRFGAHGFGGLFGALGAGDSHDLSGFFAGGNGSNGFASLLGDRAPHIGPDNDDSELHSFLDRLGITNQLPDGLVPDGFNPHANHQFGMIGSGLIGFTLPQGTNGMFNMPGGEAYDPPDGGVRPDAGTRDAGIPVLTATPISPVAEHIDFLNSLRYQIEHSDPAHARYLLDHFDQIWNEHVQSVHPQTAGTTTPAPASSTPRPSGERPPSATERPASTTRPTGTGTSTSTSTPRPSGSGSTSTPQPTGTSTSTGPRSSGHRSGGGTDDGFFGTPAPTRDAGTHHRHTGSTPVGDNEGGGHPASSPVSDMDNGPIQPNPAASSSDGENASPVGSEEMGGPVGGIIQPNTTPVGDEETGGGQHGIPVPAATGVDTTTFTNNGSTAPVYNETGGVPEPAPH